MGEVQTAGTRTQALADAVLAAMTTGVRTAGGEPVTATAGPHPGPREWKVSYAAADGTPVGERSFRIDSAGGPLPSVQLQGFTLYKYEQRYHGHANAIALHEQFLANLSGARLHCMLWTQLAGEDGYPWAPYYAWAPDFANVNAAAVQAGVERIAQVTQAQTVWNARNLADRVLGIGAAARTRHASWADLIRAASPGELREGLDAIHAGLAKATFSAMPAWFAEHEAIPALAGADQG